MNAEQRKAILDRHVRELAEVFDSVQVLASWLNPENTTSVAHSGSGNWYARKGMAHEFIELDIARDAAAEIAKKLEPPPDTWLSH